MRPVLAAAVLLSCALAGSPARGADDALRFYEDQEKVVTALRRAQPADEAPASVDVITRREIEQSGAVDLCDLLRFRPGLDVIDGRNTGGSNRCVISIRGMARDQVRELMVLINGHSVYSPLSGVILWEQLPVQMQDIQRVEIVRGPNAALYGSGAGLGVINIITKAPAHKLEASAAARGGSLGQAVTEEAVDDERGGFSYRVSHAFREQDGYPTVTGLPSNDFLHSQKGAARALWRPSDATTLDLYAGGSWDTLGEPTGFGGFNTGRPQGRFRSHLESLRLSRQLADANVLELSLTRNEQATVNDPASNGSSQFIRYYEYTLDAVHSFEEAEGYHLTWGANLKYTVADSADLFGAGTPLQVNRAVRGFAHQTARLNDRLKLVGGVSLEQPYYVGTRHADYQAALLYTVQPGHVARFSYAMAHTNPGLVDERGRYEPVTGAVFVIPNQDLKSYELQNYELGYRGQYWRNRLTLGLSLYYMKIRDHVNIENLKDEGVVPGPQVVLQYDNSNYLLARGMELEGSADLGAGRTAYANYSQETVSDRDGHSVYIKTTPRHIVNLGFIAPVWGGLTASANAGWKDGYLADSVSGTNQVSIPPFWRLDARLSYEPLPDLSLFVGGRDLFQARHVEFVDGLTVPRTWYGGARVRFR